MPDIIAYEAMMNYLTRKSSISHQAKRREEEKTYG
jgi:hypothetical protein